MQNNRIAVYSGIFLGSMLSLVILLPSVFADTFFLIQKDGSTPIQSCTESNGFVLAQNITDLCDVVIITPMNNEVLQYNGSFWVNAVVSGSDDTICANVGSGAQVFKDGECNFRTLVGSSDISIVQNLNEIVIDFNGTAGADTTACINVGTGTGYSCVEGTNVNLRSLLAGTGISITNNTNTITIANTGITVCSNIGSGVLLASVSGNFCLFKTLIAGTGITITDTTNDYTFDSQCNNTGTGEAICESSNNINSLIAGNGITITDTTGDLTIASRTVFIVKTSDETVNNSAVLQNDNHLSFSVDANSVYYVQTSLRMDIKASSDFKHTFIVPTGAVATGVGGSANAVTWYASGTLPVDEIDLTGTNIVLTTANRNTIYAPTSAYIITGVNAGTVQFQWAQNTAQAEDTILKTGSLMIVTEVI